jgi:hypothetical protein
MQPPRTVRSRLVTSQEVVTSRSEIVSSVSALAATTHVSRRWWQCVSSHSVMRTAVPRSFRKWILKSWTVGSRESHPAATAAIKITPRITAVARVTPSTSLIVRPFQASLGSLTQASPHNLSEWLKTIPKNAERESSFARSSTRVGLPTCFGVPGSGASVVAKSGHGSRAYVNARAVEIGALRPRVGLPVRSRTWSVLRGRRRTSPRVRGGVGIRPWMGGRDPTNRERGLRPMQSRCH